MADPYFSRRGRGRGQGPLLQMWECRPGKAPGNSLIKPDPESGHYKLHVRSVPLTWNKTTLFNAFSKVGTPLNVYLQRANNYHLQWGFVEYATFEEAREAVAKLNDNVVLDHIEVMFAREKTDYTDSSEIDFHDPTFEYLMEQSMVNHLPPPPPVAAAAEKKFVNPHKLMKTANEACFTYTTEDTDKKYHLEVVDAEKLHHVEEVFFQKLLKIHKENPATGNCCVCQTPSSLACPLCSILYCSENCQAKDWPCHADICNLPKKSEVATKQGTPLFDGSDAGNNSYISKKETQSDCNTKENRFNGNRFGNRKAEENQQHDSRFRRSSSERRSKAEVASSSIGENRRQVNSNFNQRNDDRRSGSRQSVVAGQKHMFEERKSRLSSNRQNQMGSERKEENLQNFRSNERYQPTEKNDKTISHIQIKKEPVVVSNAQETKVPEVNGASEVTEIVDELLPGQFSKIMVCVLEAAGVYYVCLCKKLTEQSEFMNTLAQFKPSDLFTPVENGVCISLYDNIWCRCRITSLNPLSVFYLDYGNSEVVNTERLFTIPPDLASKPPYVIKLKLADGTPAEFLELQAGTELEIKPIHKEEDYWVVQVAGVTYPTTPVSQSAQVKQEPVETTALIFPKKFSPDVFTEVCVKNRKGERIAVMPLSRVEEFEGMMQNIQSVANGSPAITPQLNARCIVKCSKTKQWWRGRIHLMDPLKVYFVDHGKIEQCTADDLKVPPSYITCSPFVINVRANEESAKEIMQNEIFSIRPISKDGNVWVVDVALSQTKLDLAQSPVTSKPPSEPEVNNQLVKTAFPDMFVSDSFTTVVVTFVEEKGEDPADTYYVGPANIWTLITDMNINFTQVADKCDVLTPKHGALGIALYNDGFWYRVKVVSLSPLLVQYIDCGNIDPVNPGDLKICPDTHREIPRLAHRIKLAPGTDKQYYGLQPESELSVKPTSLSPDGSTVVQIEGVSYDEAVTNEESVETAKNEVIQSSAVTPTVFAESSHETKSTPIIKMEVVNTEVSDKAPEQAPQPQYCVDLLEEGWSICLMPNSIDKLQQALICQLYTGQIPDTKMCTVNEYFDKLLTATQYDPNYKPNEGELVGCKVCGDWTRALVLDDGILQLVDLGDVVRQTYFKKLPQQFSNAPFMATVFVLENKEILEQLVEEMEITVTVKKIETDKKRHVQVHGQFGELTIVGELQSWNYEPLSTPYPLSAGDLVTICKVIDSNTVFITLADNQMAEQKIQIECRKSGEKFMTRPSVGDYVAVFIESCDIFYRSRINSINTDTNSCDLFNIDVGTEIVTDINNLHPLPVSLKKLPCQVTKVILKDVEKVELTEEFQIYISNIVQNEKALKIVSITDREALLTTSEEGDNVNKKLVELLKPKPDLNGKYTIRSLPDPRPLMNEAFNLAVTQTKPLYIQYSYPLQPYQELHSALYMHCEADKTPYNPCKDELCLAKFEGEWYRSLCLRETNQGVSSLMLIDFGNMLEVETKDIRRIQPDMLKMPSLGLACKIKGLPSNMSPELEAAVNKELSVYSMPQIIIESESEGYYEVMLPDIMKRLSEQKLI